MSADEQLHAPDLSQLSQRVHDLHADSRTATVLQRVSSWYVTSLLHEEPLANVLVAAGLETLAYWYLVQTQNLSRRAFERMPAADALRLLMSHCSLDLEVPASLDDLARYAAGRQGEDTGDGPWCVVEFRNSIVHPPSRPARHGMDQPQLQYEAYILGCWYLDLAVLRFLGYDGAYRKRVENDWPAEMVPWSSQGGRVKGYY